MRNRIESLDLFRGLGALTVFLFHATQPFPRVTLFSHGYLAVDMFFIVSGYVLARKFEHRLASGELRAVDYLKHRVSRLYPLLLTGVLFGAAAGLCGEIPDFSPAALLLHLLILPTITSGRAFLLNPVEWSLFCELLVNAAHAFAATLLTTVRLKWMVVGLGVSYALAILDYGTADLGSTSGTVALGVVRSAFGFSVGLLIFRTGRSKAGHRSAALASGATFLATILLCGVANDTSGLLDLATIATFPFVLTLAGQAQLNGAIRRAVQESARISYPLYALHYPALLIAQHEMGGAGRSTGATLAYVAVVIGTFATVAIGTRLATQRPRSRRDRSVSAGDAAFG